MSRNAWTVAILGTLLLAAGIWQPQDPDMVDIARAHAEPSAAHPLGTDHLGRDMLARLMRGAGHTGVVLATIGAVSFVLGTGLGAAAATIGGLVEQTVLRLAEFVTTMPTLVFALTVTALLGLTPLSAGLALGIAGAGPYALVAHGLSRRLMAMPFARAAEALGAAPLRVALVHVLPNCAATMRTYLASDAGRNVVHYAALAFLGLGADAASPDWGAMLYEYRMFIFDRPELMLMPGMAITLTTLTLTLLIEPRSGAAGVAHGRETR